MQRAREWDRVTKKRKGERKKNQTKDRRKRHHMDHEYEQAMSGQKETLSPCFSMISVQSLCLVGASDVRLSISVRCSSSFAPSKCVRFANAEIIFIFQKLKWLTLEGLALFQYFGTALQTTCYSKNLRRNGPKEKAVQTGLALGSLSCVFNSDRCPHHSWNAAGMDWNEVRKCMIIVILSVMGSHKRRKKEIRSCRNTETRSSYMVDHFLSAENENE